MHSRELILRRFIRQLSWLVALSLCAGTSGFAQRGGGGSGGGAATGANPVPPQVEYQQLDIELYARHEQEKVRRDAQLKELVASGVISALDVDAPKNAVDQYNHALPLMKGQNPQEAIKYMQKAIAAYPKFVAAYMAIGQAYFDLDDVAHARSEFEAAAKLDDKFAPALLNLGRLAMSQNDFASAQSALGKAASLRPQDAKILTSLVYAQNGNHDYHGAIETAQRVHALEHKGMASVHNVAAMAAMAIQDYGTMERELNLLISEDPANPAAPTARQNLAILARNKEIRLQAANDGGPQPSSADAAAPVLQTFPNTDRLKAELKGVGNESEAGPCENCDTVAEANATPAGGASGSAPNGVLESSTRPTGLWTIRKSVDDVAVFFSVSNHGHMVNDLVEGDIQVRDDDKPPAKIMQFLPQSKLPLRLALLVDTSGSVHDRFSYEKRAATDFVHKVLNGTSDLGFVAGFAVKPTITQDFTSDPGELGAGIEKLANGGGTALFDAVSLACEKLAAYPDGEHVARVLVLLSDGEDNSSNSSLRQAIRTAERTGVTIYTLNTRIDYGENEKTDADKVLEMLAERSGGEAMFPGDFSSLGKYFDKLHDLIRSRYFIAYKPADFHPDGRYRSISIIAQKNGKQLQVRARKGYHTRVEASPN